MDKISPASHSTITRKGRQQTSQSVTNCCEAIEVSITNVQTWAQNGQEISAASCIVISGGRELAGATFG